MERTVMELEAGNYDADDSDVKQRYDNQRQLNVQLQEQKRWLEHELEQVGGESSRDFCTPFAPLSFLGEHQLIEPHSQ